MRIANLIFRHWIPVCVGLFGATVLLDFVSSLATANIQPGLISIAPILIIAVGIAAIWSTRPTSSRILAVIGLVTALVVLANPAVSASAESLSLVGLGLLLSASGCVWLAAASVRIPVEVTQSQTSEMIPIILAESRTEKSLTQLDFDLGLEEESSPIELTQSWTRSRVGEQLDRLEGSVVIHFAENERIRHFHIPVFPPFSKVPQGWCECEDETCRVTFTQLQAYGARLTLKRPMLAVGPETIEASVVLTCEHLNESAA